MTEEEFGLAEWITGEESIIQSLILIKYGIPYDVAMSLDDATRFGYVCIVKSMWEGIAFNFETKRWKKIEAPKVIGRL